MELGIIIAVLLYWFKEVINSGIAQMILEESEDLVQTEHFLKDMKLQIREIGIWQATATKVLLRPNRKVWSAWIEFVKQKNFLARLGDKTFMISVKNGESKIEKAGLKLSQEENAFVKSAMKSKMIRETWN